VSVASGLHTGQEDSRQAHVSIPEGLFEEEHGRKGFAGRVSQFYRLHPPTEWTRIEGPLRPRDLSSSFCLSEKQADERLILRTAHYVNVIVTSQNNRTIRCNELVTPN
jgi:homogentisate 1,2-dioxygenase